MQKLFFIFRYALFLMCYVDINSMNKTVMVVYNPEVDYSLLVTSKSSYPAKNNNGFTFLFSPEKPYIKNSSAKKHPISDDEFLLGSNNKNNSCYTIGKDNIIFYYYRHNNQIIKHSLEKGPLLTHLQVFAHFIKKIVPNKELLYFKDPLITKQIVVNYSPLDRVSKDIFTLILSFCLNNSDTCLNNSDTEISILYETISQVSKYWQKSVSIKKNEESLYKYQEIYTNIILCIYTNDDINYSLPANVFSTKLLKLNRETIESLFFSRYTIKTENGCKYLKPLTKYRNQKKKDYDNKKILPLFYNHTFQDDKDN